MPRNNGDVDDDISPEMTVEMVSPSPPQANYKHVESFVDESIVESWLRSLAMVQYTQAFIDNGYDDLETCKEIGDADLDAIGVLDSNDRAEILQAVESLRKDGGTHVYFILDPEYQASNGGMLPGARDLAPPLPGGARGVPGPLLPLSRLQLTAALQQRLAEDDVDLTKWTCDEQHDDQTDIRTKLESISCDDIKDTAILVDNGIQETNIDECETIFLEDTDCAPPLPVDTVHRDNTTVTQTLSTLAKRYACDLHSNYQDVFQCLQDLHQVAHTHNEEDISIASTPTTFDGMNDSPPVTPYSMISVYGQSPRSVPPPLPNCSPPCNNYEDPPELNPSQRESPSHSSRCPLLPREKSISSNLETKDGTICGELGGAGCREKRNSTLGRLFKSISFLRTGKKYSYRQYEGDLSASEITMSEEDRIELMIRVKEGKLSMHDAVEIVKEYERRRRSMSLSASENDVAGGLAIHNGGNSIEMNGL